MSENLEMRQTETLKQICRTGLLCPHRCHLLCAIIISLLPGPGFSNSHCGSMLNDYQNGCVLRDLIAIKPLLQEKLKLLSRGTAADRSKLSPTLFHVVRPGYINAGSSGCKCRSSCIDYGLSELRKEV